MAKPVNKRESKRKQVRETHLPLGKGNLAVPKVLKSLGTVYNGIVSLEGYTPGEGERLLAENMAYLRKHKLAPLS